MTVNEILELIRAGYTRADIEQMNGESTPTRMQETAPAQKQETAPAQKQETAPVQKQETAPVQKQETTAAEEQYKELMKAIAGLTAAVQMQNLVQSGNVGSASGISPEKALAMGTFGGMASGK